MKRLFPLLALVLLLLPLACYPLLGQRESPDSEELARFPALRLDAVLDGSFQEQFEQALKDQFVLHTGAVRLTQGSAAAFKRAYNRAGNLLHGRDPDAGLVPFGKVYRMDGTHWLTNWPYTYDEETAAGYRRKAGELNRFAARHPDMYTYVYYCSRAEDLPWFDEVEDSRSYSYSGLLKGLLSEDIRFDELKFADFSQYRDSMYRTDHHWNNKGAARGYSDIFRMLDRDFDLGRVRSILYTEDFGDLRWQGSRARESAASIPEEGLDAFLVDRYQLPACRTYFGEREQAVGLREEYAAGAVNRELGFDQYLNYYGFESQPIRLEFEGNEHNLLIVGDSFTRAIREVLASHFGTTVYVNFRILGQVDLDELVERYGIDAALFMGQQDAWSGYFLEEGEG